MDGFVTVYEFDCIAAQRVGLTSNDGTVRIPAVAFSQLKKIILPRTAPGIDFVSDDLTEAAACMTIGAYGGEEVVRVKNYVGVITLPCGFAIEILPKIGRGASDLFTARRLVVEMLKASGILPYKKFRNSSLSVDKIHVFDLYIRYFIDEVLDLYAKGLKSGYVEFESNERFFKGKLLISEQLKGNFAHKERFYVRYDEFDFNRPENRLIKSALLFLANKSNDVNNRKDLHRLALLFDEIKPSDNVESDFHRCSTDRSVKEYATVIGLCKVFLRRKSFSIYGGKSNATALLFPMDKLFEKYVAKQMQMLLSDSYTVVAQKRGRSLFDGAFPMQPDLYLTDRANGDNIIIDTKWKLLNNKDNNFGISQVDMYQMYAYHVRFDNIGKVIVLYPLYESSARQEYTVRTQNVTVQIRYIDLHAYAENCTDAERKKVLMDIIKT